MADQGQLLRRQIGVNTRRARERLDLTQKKLADAIHRELITVQRWEAGTQGTIDLLAVVAHALGVSPGALCRPVQIEKREPGRPRKRALLDG